MTSHYSLLKIKGQAVFQRQGEGRKRRLAVTNWVLETLSLINAAEGLVCPIFQRGSEPRREHKANGEQMWLSQELFIEKQPGTYTQWCQHLLPSRHHRIHTPTHQHLVTLKLGQREPAKAVLREMGKEEGW